LLPDKTTRRRCNRGQVDRIVGLRKNRAPFKVSGVYYLFKNDGLQDQDLLYRKRELHGEEEVVFDPNTWSEDGTVALGGLAFSQDGRW